MSGRSQRRWRWPWSRIAPKDGSVVGPALPSPAHDCRQGLLRSRVRRLVPGPQPEKPAVCLSGRRSPACAASRSRFHQVGAGGGSGVLGDGPPPAAKPPLVPTGYSSAAGKRSCCCCARRPLAVGQARPGGNGRGPAVAAGGGQVPGQTTITGTSTGTGSSGTSRP